MWNGMAWQSMVQNTVENANVFGQHRVFLPWPPSVLSSHALSETLYRLLNHSRTTPVMSRVEIIAQHLGLFNAWMVLFYRCCCGWRLVPCLQLVPPTQKASSSPRVVFTDFLPRSFGLDLRWLNIYIFFTLKFIGGGGWMTFCFGN